MQAIIDFIPEKMIAGIAAGGGLIGAVGVALLLSTIKSKRSWPYFLVGFFFASYLGVNMIGIAVVALVCVALNLYAVRPRRDGLGKEIRIWKNAVM